MSRSTFRIATILRGFVSSALATRYLITLLVLCISLVYALLTVTAVVPSYSQWAAALSLPSPVFLGLFYLGVVLIISSIWYLWIVLPADSLNAQMAWRPVYFQTDTVGLVWTNLLLLAAVAGAGYVATTLFHDPEVREGSVFFATIISLPILIDFVPWQRPRRLIINANENSPLTIAYRLSGGHVPPENVLNSLALYNDLDPTDPDLSGPDLPEGMVLDVPPRV